MIVDAHAHIGVVPGTYDMPPQMQLDAMTRYGIDYALVSDIRAGETQTPPDGHTDFGVQINAEAADIVRRHADRLGLLLWCRPNAEQGYTDAFLHLYEQNRDIVKGLKLHPDIACLPVDDARVQPYLEMAAAFSLPVLVHTQGDGVSACRHVAAVAARFPQVTFIMGHLSLTDDKALPFSLMREYGNLWGDTAWVHYDDAVRAGTRQSPAVRHGQPDLRPGYLRRPGILPRLHYARRTGRADGAGHPVAQRRPAVLAADRRRVNIGILPIAKSPPLRYNDKVSPRGTAREKRSA